MSGALPNVVIIGAQKCGTTSLHSYLARHPDTSMSSPKELDFFIAERNWSRGLDWYTGHFDPAAKIRGESSPNYTADPTFPGVPERMAELIPDARLIFLVRDPIDRIRAHWIHTYSNRVEHRPLPEAVLEPDSEYVARSCYHRQLSRFLEHYPRDRVLVLEQEELANDRKETLRRVFRFLEIKETAWRKAYKLERLRTEDRRRKTKLGVAVSNRVAHRYWRRVRSRWPFSSPFEHSEMPDEVAAELAERLRDDMARFRELTGLALESWKV